jgi:CRP-like cAMP-binding protein
MKILSTGKKPFSTNPWLRVCQGMTLAGLLLMLNSMFNTTGLSSALFGLLGMPLLMLSAVGILVLLIDDLRKRYSLFSVEVYEPGEKVFKQGDLADRFYIIQKGAVEVERTTDDTKVLLGRLGAGDYFGEIALLRADGRRTACVKAVTQVELLALGKDNFDSLVSAVPSTHKEFAAKATERIKKHGDSREGG